MGEGTERGEGGRRPHHATPALAPGHRTPRRQRPVPCRERAWGRQDLSRPDKKVAEPMTDSEIGRCHRRIRQECGLRRSRWVLMASNCHGAHGYIIDEFFWEGANQRDDKPMAARSRLSTNFAADVTRAVRKVVGEDFPILLRFSQWKQQDFNARLAHSWPTRRFLKPLVDAGRGRVPLLDAPTSGSRNFRGRLGHETSRAGRRSFRANRR